MTPADLPHVPILLNETFIAALWDTGAEKYFILEEVYLKYFSYRPRQKTKDRVVTAQGAPCCHLGRVEIQIRIREFQKTWEFHILNNMQYQCILGIDFIKESKLTLDFDQKSLIIPDDQIKQLQKQGIRRAIPSSVSSHNHKYRRPTNPSQRSQPIVGPSHQQDSRQDKSPTVASRHEGSEQYNKARVTKTTKDGTNRAAERRTVRSKQTTVVRPCPYYLRSRVRQPEGFPEERRNSGLASIPQNNIRRRSLSMEALDGDPVDRSE
ncbi:uncharacterized protein TNCV_3935171 [Trichonephila clavipes]|nr:uncharacterized protein TNCV_3935171 [Trichonephila clavipes]